MQEGINTIGLWAGGCKKDSIRSGCGQAGALLGRIIWAHYLGALLGRIVPPLARAHCCPLFGRDCPPLPKAADGRGRPPPGSGRARSVPGRALPALFRRFFLGCFPRPGGRPARRSAKALAALLLAQDPADAAIEQGRPNHHKNNCVHQSFGSVSAARCP